LVTISKKIEMIDKVKKFIKKNNIDGYIFPKNDIYFTEYSKINNLVKLTNFSGSAGFALILKNKNYLFVDGRYTLQAKKESGKKFTIYEIPYLFPKNLKEVKNIKIGFDPNLFTEITLEKYFGSHVKLIPLIYDFKIKDLKINEKFYQLDKHISGETTISKKKKIIKILNKRKINYLYISSSENLCWLLNIRGKDLPNSPLANCKAIFTDKGKLYFFSNLSKILKIKKKFIKKIDFFDEKSFFKVITKLKKGNFCVDKSTCSIFEQNLIASSFKILSIEDPIYLLKSIKNNTEISNMIKSHVIDGVALTKFLYWFKNKMIYANEKKIEKKLEDFRKKSNSYLYPSFDTIAGSGPNSAIIHYRSNNLTNRKLKKNDILLIDSGGQYKWGTTDVTRTICNGKISLKIKNNFTRVLKGHISVATCDLKKNYNGHLIDKLARKSLNQIGLNYSHGTGHGVGFFLNVHEGPQALSRNNKITLKEGMILSNEPGYYLSNNYGIRIENLVFINKVKDDLKFENFTLAPIDIDMINFKMLNRKERKYLFDYHLEIYNKISSFLNKSEKKWLAKLIK
tara:strand:+ start:5104 stop:6807 length:1704 start_codon:yes stop_codon:yes gene_type:complete